MKTTFKRKGDIFLPLGKFEPEQVDGALRKWLSNSFLPLMRYLEKEICREFSILPGMISYRFGCPVQEWDNITSIVEMSDLILSDRFCSLLIKFDFICNIGCKIPGVEWGVGFGFDFSHITRACEGEKIACYGVYIIEEFVNLEEEISIGTAQAFADMMVTGLRKAYIRNS